jgi:hypothetical protein
MKFKYRMRCYIWFGNRNHEFWASSWNDAWSQVLCTPIHEQIHGKAL